MTKFLITYKGGAMGETPEAQQKIMESWMNWFGSLGDSVVDGGTPFGASASISSQGAISEGGGSALTGYSMIAAETLEQACEKAKGCPVLTGGGTIEVYETVPMG